MIIYVYIYIYIYVHTARAGKGRRFYPKSIQQGPLSHPLKLIEPSRLPTVLSIRRGLTMDVRCVSRITLKALQTF